jgi:two-component system chemotaxis response regulator CheB
MPDSRLGCLALGASTGGLHALSEFLRVLPPKIGAPILITQHLPAVFMPFFARQIEAASGRVAKVAEEGLVLQPEQVVIAPGDSHLGLERIGSRIQVKLNTTPSSSNCLPSVDPMLWSVSEIYGKNAFGVIFSGMGRDGLVGSARLVDRGGTILVQNQSTSAVWGMPRAVAEAGLASAILSPRDLGRSIAARIDGAAWK